ncbi:hypothetical protein SDRG_10864 [Saprolegnia diclina VS20]|uniref:FAD-binding FR-type domain-containing protein n=1 Tax=Saprolegnia diclina (strain VS20) TaxID=1156394 RepID=T0Q082_SAPDV|nr:hypothetical protein SDRG_10864 [Saprolegnia diclina VS20]EQC31259.1 hypothetical protein SDRG_10864 [Saprolegnia diclina VS20]|eukprot:XP_008615100.1 hypothetical protein SDRG_10864 [Saprolegnia diclina VS20]
MAPNTPHAVVHDGHFQQVTTPASFDVAPKTKEAPKASLVRLSAHWLVGLLLALSFWPPSTFTDKISNKFDPFLKRLWGIDPKVKGSGHSEMTNYTYFFFGNILPIFVAFLLVRLVTKGAPAPIPSLSHWLKRKPRFLGSLVSYGEILFLAIVIFGNVIVFMGFYNLKVGPKSTYASKIRVSAKSLGFSSLWNMVWLALPASRHCFWMEWLNIPYAHGIKYHRWLGIATVFTMVLHVGFYIGAYALSDELIKLLPCFDCNLATKPGKERWINAFGWLGTFCMLIIMATSISYVRRRYYNVFYVTHFLFIPTTLFSIMHWGGMVIWLFAAIVLYIGNRMMSSATISAPVVVRKAISYPHQVTELVVECETHYQAGDVVYLKVPAVSKTQWHPFSVASTPLHTPGMMTIYLKNLGRWSSQVFEYVRQCNTAGVDPIIYMDGGYPSPALVSSSFEKAVFIGGGIGVTPLMAQIMHILHTDAHQHVHLIWHVRDVHMMVQFQQWFHEATALADPARLHLHLYVTQPPTAVMTIQDMPMTSMVAFDLKASSIPARPYANISVTRQVLLMTVAFFCAGGLLVAVHFKNNSIEGAYPSYWPLQRAVEFLAVVVGAYWAYVVILIKPYKPMSTAMAKTPLDNKASEVMTIDAFVTHYKVQYCRADWPSLWAQITSGVQKTLTPKIGVYVSGPKTLSRAVDAMANSTLFDVHHEEFEM